MLEQAKEERRDEVFEVYADNWPSVMAFAALRTQWIRRPIDDGEKIVWHWAGLNYSSIPTALLIAGITNKDRRRVTMEIQLMEVHALKVLNRADDDAPEAGGDG